MELHINGEAARRESATLISWSEPGTHSGGSGGRVYIEFMAVTESIFPRLCTENFRHAKTQSDGPTEPVMREPKGCGHNPANS